ncbi:MAG: head GIN domain-containing protein [Flavobacteriaceae bacterium]
MKSIKILLIAVAGIVATSCHFDINLGEVNGNGNVTTEERPVGDFTGVRGSAGMDVFLTEGSENKVVVEADENLLEYIETYVENGTLKVTTKKSIGRSKSQKVHVTYVHLESIEASSGADVIGNSVIKNETLSLSSSSGADLEVEILAKEVYASSSSGSDLKVSGKATRLIADASSGSDLKARELEVISCKAEASSGADITVNVKEQMEGHASSGGDIKYYGNPSDVSVRDGASGDVRKM